MLLDLIELLTLKKKLTQSLHLSIIDTQLSITVMSATELAFRKPRATGNGKMKFINLRESEDFCYQEMKKGEVWLKLETNPLSPL